MEKRRDWSQGAGGTLYSDIEGRLSHWVWNPLVRKDLDFAKPYPYYPGRGGRTNTIDMAVSENTSIHDQLCRTEHFNLWLRGFAHDHDDSSVRILSLS